MPVTLEAFGLDKLSLDERVALRDALDDNIHAELEAMPLTPGQLAEVERRLADARANPGQGKSWAEVRAAARARWEMS